MQTIEEIAAAFEALRPEDGQRWNVATLHPGRLHISRGGRGQYAVFIEGSRESFGPLPPIAGLEHSDSVRALPSSRQFPALRLTSGDEAHGNRVMAHIAYELARRLEQEPGLPNTSLFAQVEWVLMLLGVSTGMLSPERQRGLVGECLLLRHLLIVARRLGLPAGTVLNRWWGHQPARRDFAAQDIAIEVKATGQNTRRHHVGSIAQLEPQTSGEAVYVFSIGVKTDVSAPRKLPHYVEDVRAQLITPAGSADERARAAFAAQVRSYGYEPEHEHFYLAAPGFLRPHLPPVLFAESALDRVRLTSFVGGVLPSMVSEVSYVLDLTCAPLPEADAEAAFTRLLTQPSVSYQ